MGDKLTRADLPTTEMLEKLGKDRGREAVVWYAWRNAMWAFSLLGRRPIEEMWSKHGVRYFYSVLRVNVLLLDWVLLNP